MAQHTWLYSRTREIPPFLHEYYISLKGFSIPADVNFSGTRVYYIHVMTSSDIGTGACLRLHGELISPYPHAFGAEAIIFDVHI